MGIDHEPAFNLWVKHVLKKRERMIASIRKWKTRHLKKSHKFCIKLPNTATQDLTLDAKNGNTLLSDATSKELQNVRVAFEILPDRRKALICQQFVQCHMVFNIQIKEFRCKARLVAGGYITKAPPTIMYVSAVSRETVRTVLMFSTLNDV